MAKKAVRVWERGRIRPSDLHRKVSYSLPETVASELDRRSGSERGKSRMVAEALAFYFAAQDRRALALLYAEAAQDAQFNADNEADSAGLRSASIARLTNRLRESQEVGPGVGRLSIRPSVTSRPGRRPVLVFANEVIATPIGLVTVLPLTTWKTGRRVYPTEVLLPAGTAGLPSASLVLAHQVRTISARRLSPTLGALGDPTLRDQVSRALRLWLDLEGV